jgi:hypothetical protein
MARLLSSISRGIAAPLRQVLEKIQRQGRVVDLPARGLQREVVAVVEGAHQVQRLVGPRRGQIARGNDLIQHGANLRLVEAAQIGVFGRSGDVLDHVVAAGDVRQHHRRDPGDEDPLQSTSLGGVLDRLEQGLDGAFAADQRLIAAFSLLVADQHLVGEVVVFVDQQVEPMRGAGDGGQQ